MNELELKETTAKDLIRIGFRVYVDHSNNGLPKFYGKKKLNSLKKPDLIVFYNKESNDDFVSDPFGIELKQGDSFGPHINQPIEQMRNYKDCASYIINGEEYSLHSMFLGTRPSIYQNHIYNGSTHYPFTQTEDGKNTVDFCIVRQVFSLTTNDKRKLYFGLFKHDNEGFYLQFPDFIYRLLNGGKLKKVWCFNE